MVRPTRFHRLRGALALLTALCAASAASAQEMVPPWHAVSLSVGTPNGIDLQYEYWTGRNAFQLRTGMVLGTIQKSAGWPIHQYKPEVAYGRLFRYGGHSWLKPGIGLGYSHETGENRFPMDSTEASFRLTQGIVMIPRLDWTLRFKRIKLSLEYGLTIGIARTNDRGGGHPQKDRFFYRYFPMQHAAGFSTGMFF
jgi:hypothetical protein